MQKYCAISFFKKIKYAICDEIRANLRLYIIYFVCLALGLIIGILWGIKLSSDGVELNVVNYIHGFVAGEQGIFSLFFDNFLTFVLVGIFIFLSTKIKIFSWVTFVFSCYLLLKTSRNGVYLISLCDVSSIITGVLFYLIFYLIYTIVLSISIVFIILNAKTCFLCGIKNYLIKVGVRYGACLCVTLCYSVVVSIVFCLVV